VRYTLLTLLLLTLWLALALLVVTRWNAWTISSDAIRSEEIPLELRHRFLTYPVGDAETRLSPDGSRYLYDPEYGPLEIWDIRNTPLAPIPRTDHYLIGFATDDCILMGSSLDPTRFRVLHRRHPEWWWGHFYRPEMWVLLALTAVFVWNFYRRKSVAA